MYLLINDMELSTQKTPPGQDDLAAVNEGTLHIVKFENNHFYYAEVVETEPEEEDEEPTLEVDWISV